MKDLLFEKKVCYKSALTAKDIGDKLSALIKDNERRGDRFAGKVYPSKFNLTPILGPSRNFKITMLGEIREAADIIVEITYTISSVLKAVVYGMVIGYFSFSLFLKLIGFNLTVGGIEHADYYIVATALIFLIICKLVYSSQYGYYSKYIARFLSLEVIAN